MWSNRQILAAVLNKWLQPAIIQVASGKLSKLSFVGNIEAKIKSLGWVSPMWSMGSEIAPLFNGLSSSLVEPMIAKYLQGIPDEAIPQMAHSLVNDAIKNGGLNLFEGNVVFEVEDLEELRTLLRYNLPITENETYQVKTEETKLEENEQE
jgi:hypothetical protein